MLKQMFPDYDSNSDTDVTENEDDFAMHRAKSDNGIQEMMNGKPPQDDTFDFAAASTVSAPNLRPRPVRRQRSRSLGQTELKAQTSKTKNGIETGLGLDFKMESIEKFEQINPDTMKSKEMGNDIRIIIPQSEEEAVELLGNDSDATEHTDNTDPVSVNAADFMSEDESDNTESDNNESQQPMTHIKMNKSSGSKGGTGGGKGGKFSKKKSKAKGNAGKTQKKTLTPKRLQLYMIDDKREEKEMELDIDYVISKSLVSQRNLKLKGNLNDDALPTTKLRNGGSTSSRNNVVVGVDIDYLINKSFSSKSKLKMKDEDIDEMSVKSGENDNLSQYLSKSDDENDGKLNGIGHEREYDE